MSANAKPVKDTNGGARNIHRKFWSLHFILVLIILDSLYLLKSKFKNEEKLFWLYSLRRF